ncbi:uncharacterized protein LOC128998960 [Macrosteles quadrilineatus]|uniref:uncharacterized protein LOC128998960 n=1 Tax=Macrosteles quadrilineatus TaxID=74068 RepID=UPI0023E1BBCC|nr:uncharacterized protein LOC128998960 [Macrosteles quadrilineatus]
MSEKKKFCFFVTCLYLAVAFAEQLEATTNIVEVATKHGNNLKNGSIFSCCNESLNKSNPTIYCYHGNDLKLSITTAEAVISLRHDDFSLFWGKNNQEVLKKFRDKKPVFKFYIFDLSKFRINIDPHKKTCFGIVSSKNYTLNVTEKLEMPDYPMIYQLGMWLFLYCRNEVMSVYEYYYFATWIIFIPLMLYVSLSLTPDPHQSLDLRRKIIGQVFLYKLERLMTPLAWPVGLIACPASIVGTNISSRFPTAAPLPMPPPPSID